MKPTYSKISDVAIKSYNSIIQKQILPNTSRIVSWDVTDINGTSAIAHITADTGVTKQLPIVRQDLGSLFPANVDDYHVHDAYGYSTFSGDYDGGQEQVLNLLDVATRLNHTTGYIHDAGLEKALAWLWITKRIYIPITDVDVVDISETEYVVEHGITTAKSILSAYRISAKPDSLGFIGSTKLILSSIPSVKGFEFIITSPDIESSNQRFALILDRVAGDWKVYENDIIAISPSVNTLGFDVISQPGKITILFSGLKGTTRRFVVQGTAQTVKLENHVSASRNVDVKGFINNIPFYQFNLPTVDLTVPEKLPTHVVSLASMFTGCSYFNQDISMWDTSNVTDLTSIFSGCIRFNQPLNDWDVSNVTDMSYMFAGAKVFNQDLDKWNVSKVVTMYNMFGNSIASFNGNISTWDVSNVRSMNSMFNGATAFNQDLSNWDTSNVTNMSYVFNGAMAFNQDLSNWDTSNVTNMSYVFNRAIAFNQDLSNWNTSNVTDMNSMFQSATSFNQPLNTWDVSKVTSTKYMFNNTRAFNQDLSNWDVSNVTDMSYMFNGAMAFNQDLSNWDTSNVTNMSYVFNRCILFNQDIGMWNVSNVTNLINMFADATVFNQDISTWDVSKATNMRYMFNNTEAFNQDLSNWDVSNVTDMIAMFAYAKAFNQDLSGWCVTKTKTEPQSFAAGGIYTKPKPIWGTCPVRQTETETPETITE